MSGGGAHQAAEAAARQSYGRLLSITTARTRDVAAAENALAEAFARALEAWPRTGVPDSPEAWLITTARRVAGQDSRRAATRTGAAEAVEMLYAEMEAREMSDFPDDRLKLLFACAHPAIDPAIRTPLMLQCVLGLTAEDIGRAFLIPGPSMGQRLVRAKTRLRDAGIPFRTPDPGDLPDRLEDVLAAIYAAFGTGWDMVDGGEAGAGLTREALYLGRLVMEMLPDEPEPKGLLSLMLYCEARRPARRDAAGAYVPLPDQPRSLWLEELVIEAEGLLSHAAKVGRFGRFQTEAAIQSVHMQTAEGEPPDARALTQLYDLLADRRPTTGAFVGRALAHGALRGAEAGLALLDEIPAELANAYQPYWAARLHLARQVDDPDLAGHLKTALALTRDEAARAFLLSTYGDLP